MKNINLNKNLLLLKICFILFVTIFSSAYANEFMEKLEEVRKKKDNTTFTLPVTLNEYISKHPSWSSSDKASLSYIASRCGILFEVISERYKNIADAQEIYNMSLTNAVIFLSASSDIYKASCINLACIEEETITSQKRAKKWASIYEEEAEINIKIYGEMIHGDIKSDFSTCMSKVKPIVK